jgi:predicted hotdog family 3-hydroxylacyl-ACP dehydratase
MPDRPWIEAHIPHQGGMCLLDAVLEWTPTHIVCRSATHRSPSNPLRAAGSLAAVCGIEYGAQAIALHGALLAADYHTAPEAGYLASVRNVQVHIATLDAVQADITIRGERLAGDSRSVLYAFTVSAGERLLLGGRASIVLAMRAPR